MKIQIIGAGGIVRDAHLPAYQLANFDVAGIFDVDGTKAHKLAEAFSIPDVYPSIAKMTAAADKETIFDVAVPGKVVLQVLSELPDEAVVLIQKPMGDDLDSAQAILELCRKKKLKAGINFQMRYSPYIQKAREIISSGQLGELCDIEIKINVFTPWHLWDFLFSSERVEILYHSIHYVDLVRSFLGNPNKIYAKTVKHPKMQKLASVKSNIIMDYGEMLQANILTNHAHEFGLKHQQSYVKIEGTKGAVMVEMGLYKDYPRGTADKFEYVILEEGKKPVWQEVKINGTWFPHAFIGSMAEMKKALENPSYVPDNSVEDCIYTMACVEAAYASNDTGGVQLERDF
ncbi:Gfo/Idh/MocA family oxidoreductase [Echinicola sp. CAU 1574]|uniref:Gfo/Idh/MocA family oxidoreductase n=1 Tax=Echinicola arenosa TaxID=2774144 RepID=A0ABR9AQC4_9BACT|nr:Gfo/Idh/MocA family oxidoreductase [Echinicola arenosa]MBD8489799.1 Gfo/Idh/MocA family oxidoreductase [Echinicola arenosa]